jgi:magnesium-protoporphyrin IX monomethyl ester (oxidative) cyclase
MRADPKLISGFNKLWIRFFLLAVFATMYVRDHARPVFHAALGLNPTEYDYKVFRITSEIARQVFPVELDIEHPAFRAGLERMFRISTKIQEARARGGLLAGLRRAGLVAMAAATFVRLYLLPVRRNAVPETTRMQPAW